MGEVWKLDLDHGEQSVLLAMADHADDDGTRCYPSVPFLAWKTGYSESQVRRIMKQLRESGLIVPVANEGGGRGNPVEYHIHLEKGSRKPPFSPKRQRDTLEAHDADLEPADDSENPSAVMTPFTPENPRATMTPFTPEKGSQIEQESLASETERVAFTTIKPSIAMTPEPSGTINNHQGTIREPSGNHQGTIS